MSTRRMSVSKKNFGKPREPSCGCAETSPFSWIASCSTIGVLTHPRTLSKQKSRTQKMMQSWTQRGESFEHLEEHPILLGICG